MKTLAELRRDARSGKMSMEMLEWYGKTGEDIKANLRGIRKVEGANSVALLLRNNEGNISELRVQYATLVEYDGENLTVYAAGFRDLTEEEKRFFLNGNVSKRNISKRIRLLKPSGNAEIIFRNALALGFTEPIL